MYSSTAGATHVLCVSGLHVGFVLAGTLLAAGVLGISRRWLPVAVLPVLAFYALMTGMGPAVLRASVMIMAVLWAARLDRERDWPTALAMAAGLLLLYNPSFMFEIGFQLSFAATWGILYTGPPLNEVFIKRWSLPRWVGTPLVVTAAAQLGTLPLLMYYFNLFTPVAPLANLLLVPLVGVIMLAGFMGSAAGLIFLPAAGLINAGTGLLIDLFLWLAGLLNGIPGGTAYLATPPRPAVLLWYAGLVLVVEAARGRFQLTGLHRPKQGAVTAAGLLLILVIFWPWSSTGGRMQVHFLDVGQGDSILVRFPGGQTMLVDAGGRPGEPEEARQVGDAVVVPYLHRLGINKLDALVVTHPHDDHAGGVPAVVDKLSVRALVLSRGPGYDDLLSQLESKRVPVYRVGAGQMLRLDNRVEVLVLGPGNDAEVLRKNNLNDNSLVLRLEYGDVSFLLTGDIEEQAQRQLLGGGAELRSDVLKVPHHGSRFYEPRFYQAVSPAYAVIQVGERNRFGHPAQKAVETLVSSGARVLRTDMDGAVLFISDGRELEIRTVKTSTLKVAN